MDQQVIIGFEQLRRALESTRAVLAKVQRDQLGLPTPCASWDVAALINHFVGSARWAAQTVSSEDATADEDFAGGNFVEAYSRSIGMLVKAFGAEEVLDKQFALPIGDYSGADLLGLAAREQFIHGWDLARSIGHTSDLEPDLAADLLTRARVEISDELRGPDGLAFFGLVIDATDEACSADRLAAFLGRMI
ncbi:TIGR03086 family metal-binding protein [Nocardia sp. KC 131]|uniref:TIGR03086 family metal-binding protein n=1 Tax=Nocardia arseniciresistens TaxID=3392119 RepID=UPI00398F5819